MRLRYFSSSVNSFFKHPVGLDIGPFVLVFMCANSEGSDETVRKRRLVSAFVGRLCGKYHNLMSCAKGKNLRQSWLCVFHFRNAHSEFTITVLNVSVSILLVRSIF